VPDRGLLLVKHIGSLPDERSDINMQSYHFLTHWTLPAPVEMVWQELIHVPDWPKWWPGWRRAVLQTPGGRIAVGATLVHEVRGFLPYSLRFVTDIVSLAAPTCVALRAHGGLIGGGSFRLAHDAHGTHVTFRWDVAAGNGLLDQLGRVTFCRRLFERNHACVMRLGHLGLSSRLRNRSAVALA
jgi:hypothetical protein